MKKIIICTILVSMFLFMGITAFAAEDTSIVTFTTPDAPFGISVNDLTLAGPFGFGATTICEIPITIHGDSASSITVSAEKSGTWTDLDFCTTTGAFDFQDLPFREAYNNDVFMLFLTKELQNDNPSWFIELSGGITPSEYISSIPVELVEDGQIALAGDYTLQMIGAFGYQDNAPYETEYSLQLNWTATSN